MSNYFAKNDEDSTSDTEIKECKVFIFLEFFSYFFLNFIMLTEKTLQTWL